MDIITENKEIFNNFFLHFRIYGEGCEFYDIGLPPPNHIHHTKNILDEKIVYWAWLLDGYFATAKGREFLNDVIARFLISFKDLKIERLPYKPNKIEKAILGKAYKLKELSIHLESIPTHKQAPNRANMFEDFVFWAIKLFAEDEIRQTGFIVYEKLQSFAFNNFIDTKEKSTLKAKCRSVWNYYEERDFKLNEYQRKLSNEELKMTRAENGKKVAEDKVKETIAKLKSAIVYLTEKEEKINITNLAKHTGLHRNTVSKYKELWKK